MRKRPRDLKAVIFDMDGVIIDSMAYHYLAWYEALQPFGVRVSCFDVYEREGERWQKTVRELLLKEGIRPTEKLLKRIFSLRTRLFKSYFKRFFIPGAQELLTFCRDKGHRVGLVTGTPLPEIRRILPDRLLRLFSAVVSGDQIKNGKPHPEAYLKVARMLKVRPRQCLVVENAPFGIQAAKRAGMYCIGLATSLPRSYLERSHPDMIVERLAAVEDLLDSPSG